MVCFQTENPNLGKFWKALEWKMLVYFMVMWNILRSFGIFCGHLVTSFWCIVSRKIWQPCKEQRQPFETKKGGRFALWLIEAG
jgi:hypothetical protein